MNLRKFLLCFLLVAIMVPSAMAERRKLDRQDSDSVATALATIWGTYMRDKNALDGDAVSAEYMRGVMDVLDPENRNDAYIYGVQQALTISDRIRQVQNLGDFDIDYPLFLRMLRRAAEGKPTGFSTQTAQQKLDIIMAHRTAENYNIDHSPSYLKEQEMRQGVVRTPSGLLFEVVTEGEGAMPGPNDLVKVNYTGRLIDGTVFNATEPDKPVIFEVAGTIPGFKEGLQMMKKGGKYRLFIPAEIGYGAEGVPGVIPGGAATVFDIELIDFRTESQIQDAIKNNTSLENLPQEK